MQPVWIDGVRLLSGEGAEASGVSPFDRGLAYGDGLFSTMRSHDSGIFFLDAHLDRLTQGAARLGFTRQSQLWTPDVALSTHLLQVAAEYPNACIKLILTRGEGGRGYAPPADPQFCEIVSVSELPALYRTWQQEGICLQTSAVTLARQPLLAGMKHLNRLEQVLIRSRSLDEGFDDWLITDTQGNIIETSAANLFLCVDGHWYTPSLAQCGVAGVMRQQVIAALLEAGYHVTCTDITPEWLAAAGQVFITNSLLGLVDIRRIDTQDYSIWPHTAVLRQSLGMNL